jgi:4-amino-4-deoxy-L-arabinose transferase-like glycosyltransferase
MNTSSRRIKRALTSVCAALAVAIVVAPWALAAAPIFHFQRESMSAYRHQLAAGEIHAATFNKVPHSLHLSLNNHQHMLVVYPPKQYKAVVAELEAKGVPVAVKHVKAAAKPTHHKLRYIAGGVLVLVILIVLGVLLVGRRRALLEESEKQAGEGASEPSSPV